MRPPRWLRDPTHFYEHHPVLGDYVYESTIAAWSQGRITVDKNIFLLRGRARSPTDVQVALWNQIEARLAELVKAAIAAVPEPPDAKFHARFSKTDLELAEVRIEPNLTIYLFFRSPIEDAIELAPMVGFTDWQVTTAEWVC